MGSIIAERLRESGIQPSAQRLAVAEHVLATDAHPTAEQVWATVRAGLPEGAGSASRRGDGGARAISEISRATVYNTLSLLVRKGLLRQVQLGEGRIGYDPNLEPHHHFIDDATGQVTDLPWDALEVRRVDALRELEVREYQVVLRGRRARAKTITG